MNTQLDVREEGIPDSLADIVGAIVVSATLKLMKRFGGIRVYVPRPEHLTEDHPIARAIGFEAARALSRLADGSRIGVPRGTTAIRRARNRAIRREPRAVSVPQLALKYRLTERQIYNIRSQSVSLLTPRALDVGKVKS